MSNSDLKFCDSRASPLRLMAGTAVSRDPDAASFLLEPGLSMSSLVLALFDQSDDCIKIIDPSGKLRLMNCNGRQAMEIDDFAQFEGLGWSSLWPSEAREMIEQALEAAREGSLSRFEAPCPTAKGTSKWWEVTVSPVTAESGEVAAILASSRDISEQKRHVEQLTAMAHEMRHRLRNAFAIGSAVSLAMGRDDPVNADFARILSARLIGLAEVQAELLDTGKCDFATIVQRIVHSFGEHDKPKIGTMPTLALDENQGKAVVLVLSEMATNSLKYGALSGRGQLHVDAAIDDGCLVIDWHEEFRRANLVSEVARPQVSSGAGYELKVRMLATVGGTIEIEKDDSGYRARITLPVR